MKTQEKHTPTPKYGSDETGELMQDVGLLYAIRTLDPLSNQVNGGSDTLAYCATNQQAAFIVRVVNEYKSDKATIKALLEDGKKLLDAVRQGEDKLSTPTYRGVLYALANKMEKAIAQAERV